MEDFDKNMRNMMKGVDLSSLTSMNMRHNTMALFSTLTDGEELSYDKPIKVTYSFNLNLSLTLLLKT